MFVLTSSTSRSAGGRRYRRSRGVGRDAAAHDRRHVGEGLLDHAVDTRDRRLVDQWAHVGIWVQTVADANALEDCGQPRANLVRDAALDEDPRAGHAELPGERRDAGRQQRDGAVEVGVVEDDHRRLAAELEVHSLQGRGAVGGDDPPDGGAPGVADDLHVGRGDEVGRAGVPGLREEVDHAARERLDLGEDLRHAIGDQRRLSRHLDRDCVARRQRRSERPDQEENRRVPRDDRHDHAGRLGVRAEPLPRGDLRGDTRVRQRLPRAVVQREARQQPLHHAFGELLAVLSRHQAAELLGMGIEAIGHLAQRAMAQVAVARPHSGVKRAPGGRDRGARLGLAAVRPAPQNLTRGRVGRLRDAVGPGPLSVDPMLRDVGHVLTPFDDRPRSAAAYRRSSATNASGCSSAGKCPPADTVFHITRSE